MKTYETSETRRSSSYGSIHSAEITAITSSTSVDLESENICLSVSPSTKPWDGLETSKMVKFGWGFAHLFLEWIPGVDFFIFLNKLVNWAFEWLKDTEVEPGVVRTIDYKNISPSQDKLSTKTAVLALRFPKSVKELFYFRSLQSICSYLFKIGPS